MGVQMHIDFLMSKDDLPEYNKYKAVLDSCIDAGVEPPSDVMDYFGGFYDADEALQIAFEPRELDDENREGFEIDIEEIPAGTKTIRFYLS